MIELWEAISTFYKSAAAADFRAALTGGLHDAEASRGVIFPYGTFQLVSAVPDHFASNKNYVENCLIQFNLFSNKRTKRELLNICDKLIACFDFLALIITNYTTRSCVREGVITLPRVEKVWQINITYRLLLEPD